MTRRLSVAEPGFELADGISVDDEVEDVAFLSDESRIRHPRRAAPSVAPDTGSAMKQATVPGSSARMARSSWSACQSPQRSGWDGLGHRYSYAGGTCTASPSQGN